MDDFADHTVLKINEGRGTKAANPGIPVISSANVIVATLILLTQKVISIPCTKSPGRAM
jgi:hypothetical protein